MKQIFGEFIENFPVSYYSLELNFTEGSPPIKQAWRNNLLSASFLAEYFSNYLSNTESEFEVEERVEEIKTTLTYIGNELLDNARKFHETNQQHQVQFGIHFLPNLDIITAVVLTKNCIDTQKIDKFKTLIEELLSSDTHELYVKQIEKTATDEDSEASGLGLLSIINDYSAKLGWKFEPSNSQMTVVTTMAQIVV